MSGIRIKAKAKGNKVEVKVLVKHPMEIGTAKDKEGNEIPAHYIENLVAMVGDEVVFSSQLGPAISKDPYLKFYYAGAVGDKILLNWTDNLGEKASTNKEVK